MTDHGAPTAEASLPHSYQGNRCGAGGPHTESFSLPDWKRVNVKRSFAFVVVGLSGLVLAAGCSSSSAAVVAPSEPATTGAPLATSNTADTANSADTAPPSTSGTSATTLATSASSGAYEPAPIDGLPIVGEGTWKAVDTVGDTPVLWTSDFHPLADVPSVKVSAAIFDQERLTAALFNGTKLPGGGPWQNADKVATPAKSALVAAFNGGFLFKHIDGGYFTEGKEIKPLIAGQATVGIRHDGRMVLGIYGKDMTNDGSWLSLRENLPPMVINGKNVMADYPGTFWGNDFHNVDLNYRTALCQRADGKLMYLAMGLVRANTLGDELARLGCTLGMELDINHHWPQFTYFRPDSRGTSGVLLDAVAMWKPERYVTTSEKDFVALFDPASLPAGSLYGN